MDDFFDSIDHGGILADLENAFTLPDGMGILGDWNDFPVPMGPEQAVPAAAPPPSEPAPMEGQEPAMSIDPTENVTLPLKVTASASENADDGVADQQETIPPIIEGDILLEEKLDETPELPENESSDELAHTIPETQHDAPVHSYPEVFRKVPRLEIHIPTATNIDLDEYVDPLSPTDRVASIIGEHERYGDVEYTVKFEDGEGVSAKTLEGYPGGKMLLKNFRKKRAEQNIGLLSDSSHYPDEHESRRKCRRVRKSIVGYADDIPSDTDSEDSHVAFRQTRKSMRILRSRNKARKKASLPERLVESDELYEFSKADDDDEEQDFVCLVKSDIAPHGRKRPFRKRGRPAAVDRDSSIEFLRPRRSGRSTKNTKSMKDFLDDDFEEYRSPASTGSIPKVVSMKEVYQKAPQVFQDSHAHVCDTCRRYGFDTQKGHLIFCQGCSLAFHKNCLGTRNAREHIVTKVGEGNFVLQCRFCICIWRKKDPMAPFHDMCQGCLKKGVSCHPFSEKMSSRQEDKIRTQNGGVHPITHVEANLINNSANLLFRCSVCHRGFHFECLPPRYNNKSSLDARTNVELKRRDRLTEYSGDWKCRDCSEQVNKIDTMVAWRPKDRESYQPGMTCFDLDEDSKEYLVKWSKRSYYHCEWASGAWVFGFATPAMRSAFAKRSDGEPKFDEKDAIPEEYLLIDIVLKVKYNVGDGIGSSKEDDIQKIDTVANIMVKFQGLGYDNVVWDAPPSRDSGPFWDAFEAAYMEYLKGKHFKSESTKTIWMRTNKFRKAAFQTLPSQPKGLVRGQLMEYQLEGVDWLRYNYYKEHSVILADEMGLGKTIQVIGLITSLVQESPRCFPFLVVVPNATCPNWRREFQQWTPEIRVVSYHGGKEPQELIYNHELFPEPRGPMKAHVVVMSYDSAQDERTRTLFKHISWAGLVVDEGQRLKNDRNLLYSALRSMRVPWRLLLTGTPLQNNKRELFNLVQFIDTSKDAASLDEEYSELTAENIPKLHELIRPYFLRRTKAQVLKFLPAMSQVIVPITMTVLQEKLSRSILAKNSVLIKSVFARGKTKSSERASLNNILMQLRKCLCHPFVYSKAIEEKNVDPDTLQRNLTEASSKLVLLSLMLPRLKEQGSRVLMFSQFLDNLDVVEDFLSGCGMEYQRLDGNMSSLEKQKRIDAFNAPGSPYFAFLLSTRAGGVGINLATADTVIIMDPDFNPHQDIQALSRAHRIGQKNKVLCIQIVTKNSVEEKIMQIGRKKMALDHALIESMEDREATGNDLESVLKHGAEALFGDKETDRIVYDEAAIEKLLDRSNIVDRDDGDNSSENQFAFARVWEHEKGELGGQVDLAKGEEEKVNPNLWERILKQREEDALKEAAAEHVVLGRGGRRRQAVTRNGNVAAEEYGSADNSSEEYDNFEDGKQSESSSDEDESGSGQDVVDLAEFRVQRKTNTASTSTAGNSLPTLQIPSRITPVPVPKIPHLTPSRSAVITSQAQQALDAAVSNSRGPGQPNNCKPTAAPPPPSAGGSVEKHVELARNSSKQSSSGSCMQTVTPSSPMANPATITKMVGRTNGISSPICRVPNTTDSAVNAAAASAPAWQQQHFSHLIMCRNCGGPHIDELCLIPTQLSSSPLSPASLKSRQQRPPATMAKLAACPRCKLFHGETVCPYGTLLDGIYPTNNIAATTGRSFTMPSESTHLAATAAASYAGIDPVKDGGGLGMSDGRQSEIALRLQLDLLGMEQRPQQEEQQQQKNLGTIQVQQNNQGFGNGTAGGGISSENRAALQARLRALYYEK